MDAAGPPDLVGRVAATGPLRFDEYVEAALYDPASGFFATGGGAGGSGGDFVTSVEVGPLFGAVVARWLDEVWEDLGRPARFPVVEAAAGRGALALAVRAAAPACLGAIDYLLVERSEALRGRQGEHLPIEHLPIDGASAGRASAEDPRSGRPAPGHPESREHVGGEPPGPEAPRSAGVPGPVLRSAADLPRPGHDPGVVIANELLDNLPFRVCERTAQGWSEVWVRAEGGRLAEVLRPVGPAVEGALDALAPDARPGDRAPWQEQAARWCARALACQPAGRVLLFDYGDTTAALAARAGAGWLRTYRGHERAGPPLEAPGSRDITAEVALDQLPAGPAGPAEVTRQADWLRRHGLDRLVEVAQARWQERAAVGDLAALRARSVPAEARALTDPDGLGAFVAIEWRRG